MKKLLIVESPAKAKTISKYLDGKYEVIASIGHIRDLPKSNKKAIDIKGGFIPHYEISPGKEEVVQKITALAKGADVYIGTDPDREGEGIAWHIKEAVGMKKPKRIVFHEITKEAILEALKHPRDIDENLKEAQEARRVLDRLVGYDLSGLIWKKVRYGLSAGRVQSPALRILVEREREIKAFKPERYFVVTAFTKTTGKGANKKEVDLTLVCDEEIRDEKLLAKILEIGKKEEWSVYEVGASEVKRSPRPPFITSTLQQVASTRLGFSPSRTMGIAQKLYEAGYITYMRTDSTTLSTGAIEQIGRVIEKEYGSDYLQKRNYATSSKNAQEAHEAIRPTLLSRISGGHNDDQKRLYKLIWQRAVSSQMADAKTLRTKITANCSKEIPNFSANGSRILFEGWLKADPESRGEEVELPEVAQGEKLDLKDITSEEKFTEPPARYSEAGLIKELEKRGIGRPSTYASIIKTIEDRGYVEKIGKAMKPTETGEVVSTFLEDNFMHYINDSFTAEMEDKLDDIASGKRTYKATLSEFYKPFQQDVKAKEKTAKLTTLGDAPKEFTCPICGSNMVMKLSRTGVFMSCSRFPDCTGARTKEGKVIEKERPIGTDPATGLEIFVLDGRFGPYVQLGQKSKELKSPRRASIPPNMVPSDTTVADALKLLSLPRELGINQKTGNMISAGRGRFGPFIVDGKDFRSLKTDDVYTISLERAIEILSEPKKPRGFGRRKKAA